MRSWKRQGLRVIFIHVTTEKMDAWLIHAVADGYLRLTPAQFMHTTGAALVCHCLSAYQATGVTALSYTMIARLHVLSGSTSWPAKARVWATPEKTLDFLESKSAQIALAQACGMDVAPTAYLSSAADGQPVAFGYPWAIRPDGPGSVTPDFKVEAIGSAVQWSQFCERLQTIQKPIVVQPLVGGVNVVVHGARTATSQSTVHAAFEVPSMLDGVTLSLRPTTVPNSLLQACQQFVEKAQIVGIYHFEFRRSALDGRHYFLEINGRLGGTTGKVFRLGYDEPLLLKKCFTADVVELPSPLPKTKCIASNRKAIGRAIHLSWKGKLTLFDYPHQAFSQRILPLLTGAIVWKDEILYWQDFGSGLIFLLDSLRRRWA